MASVTGNSEAVSLRQKVAAARRAVLRQAGPRRMASLLLDSWLTRWSSVATLPRPDWQRVDRLVFACTGNICRSPYAQALAAGRGLPAVSFGFRARSGLGADPEAIERALRRHIDLASHATRNADEINPGNGDLVILMDERHLPLARAMAGSHGVQLALLGLFLEPAVRRVPDPHLGTPELFELSFAMIDEGVARLADDIAQSGQLARLTAAASGGAG